MAAAGERFEVRTRRHGDGWRVEIVDGGHVVGERACADLEEARLYASTVRQHAEWLSEERFREYYLLEG